MLFIDNGGRNMQFDGLKLLYVDDTPLNLTLFKGMLKDSGAMIDVCLSADDAWKLCQSKQYDIIFLDHMMPDKDGVTLYHEIREDLSGPNHDIPIVMLTGNADDEAIALYQQIGVNGYMSKPVKKQTLIDQIEALR